MLSYLSTAQNLNSFNIKYTYTQTIVSSFYFAGIYKAHVGIGYFGRWKIQIRSSALGKPPESKQKHNFLDRLFFLSLSLLFLFILFFFLRAQNWELQPEPHPPDFTGCPAPGVVPRENEARQGDAGRGPVTVHVLGRGMYVGMQEEGPSLRILYRRGQRNNCTTTTWDSPDKKRKTLARKQIIMMMSSRPFFFYEEWGSADTSRLTKIWFSLS